MNVTPSSAGQTFNRLTVLSEYSKKGRIECECMCVCGTIAYVRKSRVITGSTKSCGCLTLEKVVEERRKRFPLDKILTSKPEYKCWVSMIHRCTNTKSQGYKDYGGRGITVCDRWLESFDNFYADMGQRPGKGHSLERTDNDAGYGPANCIWATRPVQARNQRNNVWIEHNGIRLIQSEWARKFNVRLGELKSKLKTFTFEQIFSKWLEVEGEKNWLFKLKYKRP